MSRLEILELSLDRPGDYDLARVAIDGQLVTPFEIPKSIRREQFTRDEDFLRFLERQAITLLATYGDAREQRQEAFS
jgi:hypothetical protein